MVISLERIFGKISVIVSGTALWHSKVINRIKSNIALYERKMKKNQDSPHAPNGNNMHFNNSIKKSDSISDVSVLKKLNESQVNIPVKRQKLEPKGPKEGTKCTNKSSDNHHLSKNATLISNDLENINTGIVV